MLQNDNDRIKIIKKTAANEKLYAHSFVGGFDTSCLFRVYV